MNELIVRSEDKPINKNQNFEWTPKKLAVAEALSIGIEKQGDIALRFDISQETISRWKSHPEFMEKIDELTLKNESAIRAGLLREALKGLGIKTQSIGEQKTTHIDYLKLISELVGDKPPGPCTCQYGENVMIYPAAIGKPCPDCGGII